MVLQVRLPPAQPTVSTPSASESIFSRRFALQQDRSMEEAPSSPTSSLTVNTVSNLGCGISLESKIANA